jgi:hypothetical protein
MYFSTVLESIGSVKAGKLKALATSSLTRSPAMPELTTIAESGIPGFDANYSRSAVKLDEFSVKYEFMCVCVCVCVCVCSVCL